MNLIVYNKGDLVWVYDNSVFSENKTKLGLIVGAVRYNDLSEVIEYKVYLQNIIKYVYSCNMAPV